MLSCIFDSPSFIPDETFSSGVISPIHSQHPPHYEAQLLILHSYPSSLGSEKRPFMTKISLKYELTGNNITALEEACRSVLEIANSYYDPNQKVRLND